MFALLVFSLDQCEQEHSARSRSCKLTFSHLWIIWLDLVSQTFGQIISQVSRRAKYQALNSFISAKFGFDLMKHNLGNPNNSKHSSEIVMPPS